MVGSKPCRWRTILVAAGDAPMMLVVAADLGGGVVLAPVPGGRRPHRRGGLCCDPVGRAGPPCAGRGSGGGDPAHAGDRSRLDLAWTLRTSRAPEPISQSSLRGREKSCLVPPASVIVGAPRNRNCRNGVRSESYDVVDPIRFADVARCLGVRDALHPQHRRRGQRREPQDHRVLREVPARGRRA